MIDRREMGRSWQGLFEGIIGYEEYRGYKCKACEPLSMRTGRERVQTTRSTTDDDASHTFVDAFEASGFCEALGGL